MARRDEGRWAGEHGFRPYIREVGGDAAWTSKGLAKVEEVATQPGQRTHPVERGVMCAPFACACVLCVELSCVVGVGRRGGGRVARLMSRQTSLPCTVDAGIAVWPACWCAVWYVVHRCSAYHRSILIATSCVTPVGSSWTERYTEQVWSSSYTAKCSACLALTRGTAANNRWDENTHTHTHTHTHSIDTKGLWPGYAGLT